MEPFKRGLRRPLVALLFCVFLAPRPLLAADTGSISGVDVSSRGICAEATASCGPPDEPTAAMASGIASTPGSTRESRPG